VLLLVVLLVLLLLLLPAPCCSSSSRRRRPVIIAIPRRPLHLWLLPWPLAPLLPFFEGLAAGQDVLALPLGGLQQALLCRVRPRQRYFLQQEGAGRQHTEQQGVHRSGVV